MTILFVTFGIVGLGVGLGAAFPKFKFENVTQIAGSSGGVLYMMAASTFVATVLFLEAFPAYFYLSAQYRGVPLDSRGVMVIAGALSVIVVLNVLAVWLPDALGRPPVGGDGDLRAAGLSGAVLYSVCVLAHTDLRRPFVVASLPDLPETSSTFSEISA